MAEFRTLAPVMPRGLVLLVCSVVVVVATPMAAAAQDITVRYPTRGQRIAPDSNFIFGTIRTATAQLKINGQAVEVEENGAFLAWLPTPRADAGDTARYVLRVVSGLDTTTAVHPIRRPRSAPPAGAPSPWIDPGGLRRSVDRWYSDGDEMVIAIVGEGGASVELLAGDRRFLLRDTGVERGTLHRYVGRVDLAALHGAACDAGGCEPASSGRTPAGVRQDSVTAELVARAEAGETRTPVTLRLARLPDPALRVRLVEADDPVNGQSGVVVGRPTPSGPYRWRFPEGTVAPVAARVGGRVALDLGGGLRAWVLEEDLAWEPPAVEPAARVFGARASAAPGHVDLRVGASSAVPSRVIQTGRRSLRLTLYGALGEVRRIAHGAETGIVSVDWVQEAPARLHLDVTFERPIWGHRLTVERGALQEYEGPRSSEPSRATDGDEGVVFRLAVRPPPEIDDNRPLVGRRIAIDPGHPGAGSYGPTGLYEGDANLAIGRALLALLVQAGATPILVRDGTGAVGLYERTRRAREAGADLFVSIHNNALPDGVQPFEAAGSSTFYYHRHSAALARHVQDGLVRNMGLRDLGPLWGDLAVVREPWMPAVLTEGAFMMIPAQEAALRTPEFQERYARGVLEGIEAFLREIAGGTP